MFLGDYYWWWISVGVLCIDVSLFFVIGVGVVLGEYGVDMMILIIIFSFLVFVLWNFIGWVVVFWVILVKLWNFGWCI